MNSNEDISCFQISCERSHFLLDSLRRITPSKHHDLRMSDYYRRFDGAFTSVYSRVKCLRRLTQAFFFTRLHATCSPFCWLCSQFSDLLVKLMICLGLTSSTLFNHRLIFGSRINSFECLILQFLRMIHTFNVFSFIPSNASYFNLLDVSYLIPSNAALWRACKPEHAHILSSLKWWCTRVFVKLCVGDQSKQNARQATVSALGGKRVKRIVTIFFPMVTLVEL